MIEVHQLYQSTSILKHDFADISEDFDRELNDQCWMIHFGLQNPPFNVTENFGRSKSGVRAKSPSEKNPTVNQLSANHRPLTAIPRQLFPNNLPTRQLIPNVQIKTAGSLHTNKDNSCRGQNWNTLCKLAQLTFREKASDIWLIRPKLTDPGFFEQFSLFSTPVAGGLTRPWPRWMPNIIQTSFHQSSSMPKSDKDVRCNSHTG